GLEADLVAERAVELDGAHHHPRQAERAAQLADEAGRVERRAAREVGALDKDDVVPPESREPVEDRAAADTAADHDGSRTPLHASARSKCSSAYAAKSNSTSEIACCTTPHIASPKSDIQRISCSAASAASPGSP